MRANTHWVLFFVAVVAGGVAIAYSRPDGSLPCIAGGWVFFVACVLLAVLERLDGQIPLGAPRTIGWVLVVLAAAFVPLVSLSGAWGEEDSLVLLPAVGGTWLAPFSLPWLIAVGDQPWWRMGRASPMLLAWLAFAINFAVTMA